MYLCDVKRILILLGGILPYMYDYICIKLTSGLCYNSLCGCYSCYSVYKISMGLDLVSQTLLVALVKFICSHWWGLRLNKNVTLCLFLHVIGGSNTTNVYEIEYSVILNTESALIIFTCRFCWHLYLLKKRLIGKF